MKKLIIAFVLMIACHQGIAQKKATPKEKTELDLSDLDEKSDIDKIFAKKDDIDYVMVSPGGNRTEIKYYIDNGTLLYTAGKVQFRIPLKGISFNETFSENETEMKTSDGKESGKILVKMEGGQYLYWKETPRDKEKESQAAELFFPSRGEAADALSYFSKLTGKSFEIPSFQNLTDKDKKLIQQIGAGLTTCDGLKQYLAEIKKPTEQFKQHLGTQVSPGIYESKLDFPLAEGATIRDGTGGSPYRSARILLSSDNVKETKSREEVADENAAYQVGKYKSEITVCVRDLLAVYNEQNTGVDAATGRLSTVLYSHTIKASDQDEGKGINLELFVEKSKNNGKIYYKIYLDIVRL